MLPFKDNIPRTRFPIVTVALTAVNAVAYLLEVRHGGGLFAGPSHAVAVHYGASPNQLTHHPTSPATWWKLLTSMFLHGSFLALFGNMIFLALFGPAVEDAIGRLRYPAFYLLGGLLALAIQVLAEPSSTSPALGSSGAIAVVLGGYLLLYPRARFLSLALVLFFVSIVEVPALILLCIWFIEQLYVQLAGLATVGGSGSTGALVAYAAHLCCFLAGLLVIRLLIRRGRADRTLPVY
jgi:membrane associated rhomboid family serine protease